MNFLTFSLAMATATGATALVSRAFGAGDKSGWKESAQQSLSLTVIAGFIVAAFQILASKAFATLILPPGDPLANREMFDYLFNFALGLHSDLCDPNFGRISARSG